MALQLAAVPPGGGEPTASVKLPADSASVKVRVTSSAGDLPANIVYTADGSPVLPSGSPTTIGEGIEIDLPFSGRRTRFHAAAKSNASNISNAVLAEVEESDDDVSEIAIGEYDKRFGFFSGTVVLILGIFIGIAAIGALQHVQLPNATVDGSNGTFLERVRAGVSIGMLAVGAFLLLLAGWMALLETRGRLRRAQRPTRVVLYEVRRTPQGVDELFGGGGRGVGNIRLAALAPSAGGTSPSTAAVPIGEFLDNGSEAFATGLGAARRARGTVITFVVGLALVVLALLGSSSFQFSIDVGDDGTQGETGQETDPPAEETEPPAEETEPPAEETEPATDETEPPADDASGSEAPPAEETTDPETPAP